MNKIIKLEPVFKYRVWGGTRLKEYFNYDIPTDKTGEAWAISAHKNGDCLIKDGEFKGKTLSWLYKNHREYFGNVQYEGFPLLVKLIDASNDLSIQVHPDDEYAHLMENSQLGKTEAWYIIDCNKDSVLEYGHNANSKEELIDYINKERWNELLKFKTIKRGDFFYIPSGTVHAICKNTLIYEVQQSSDITYRVYDYDRVDESNGEKRELHIEKAIDVIKVPCSDENSMRPIMKKEKGYVEIEYVDSKYFKTKRFDIDECANIELKDNFALVTIIDGKGNLDGEEIIKGDNFIIPFEYSNFKIKGKVSLIISGI